MSLDDKIKNLKYRKKIFKTEYIKVMREKRRKALFDKIRKCEKDAFFLLEGNPLVLDTFLFDINPITGEKKLDIPDDIIYRIDYTNVDFDNISARGIDFTGMLNVHINPQTTFNKDMRDCVLYGTYITGRFDDVYIARTNFTGCEGALIDPRTIYDKNLNGTILTDAIVVTEFDGVKTNNMSIEAAYLITKEQKDMIYGFQKIKE